VHQSRRRVIAGRGALRRGAAQKHILGGVGSTVVLVLAAPDGTEKSVELQRR
jgi:hypothetical protein